MQSNKLVPFQFSSESSDFALAFRCLIYQNEQFLISCVRSASTHYKLPFITSAYAQLYAVDVDEAHTV